MSDAIRDGNQPDTHDSTAASTPVPVHMTDSPVLHGAQVDELNTSQESDSRGTDSPVQYTHSAPITPQYSSVNARVASVDARGPASSVMVVSSNLVPPSLDPLDAVELCPDPSIEPPIITTTRRTSPIISPSSHHLRVMPMQRSVSQPAERELEADEVTPDQTPQMHPEQREHMQPGHPRTESDALPLRRPQAPRTVMHTHRHLPPANAHQHLHGQAAHPATRGPSHLAHYSSFSDAPVRSSTLDPRASSSSSAKHLLDRKRSSHHRLRSMESPPPSPKANRSIPARRGSVPEISETSIPPAGELGGSTPIAPMSFLNQLSTSFLERIPLSLRSSSRVLAPGSILMSPMLGSGTSGPAHSRTDSLGASSASSGQLSLAEMAEQARQVKRLAAQGVGVGTPTVMGRNLFAAPINLPSARSRANSVLSPPGSYSQYASTLANAAAALSNASASSSSAAVPQQQLPPLSVTHAIAVAQASLAAQRQQEMIGSSAGTLPKEVEMVPPSPLTLVPLPLAQNVNTVNASLLSAASSSPSPSPSPNPITSSAATTDQAAIDNIKLAIASGEVASVIPDTSTPLAIGSRQPTPIQPARKGTQRSDASADTLAIAAAALSKASTASMENTPASLNRPLPQPAPVLAVDPFAPSPLQLPQAQHARQSSTSSTGTAGSTPQTRVFLPDSLLTAATAGASPTPRQLPPPASIASYDPIFTSDGAEQFGYEEDGRTIMAASGTPNPFLQDDHAFRFHVTQGRSAELELSTQLAPEHGDSHSIDFHDLNHSAEKGLGSDPVTWQQQQKDEKRVIEIFLEEMGAALFSCGLPMHVVEFYLVLVAHRLSVDIEIVAISTYFWISFPPASQAHMVVAKHPGLSLAKMVDICGVSEHILHGMVSPVEGLAQLQSITRSPSQYPKSWTVIAMTIVCFFYAPLFNSGWAECGVAAVAGFFIGLLEIYSDSHASLSRGHDLISGLLAGGLAVLCNAYITKINLLAAVFGGIVWCLPGLRVTMSMLDLSTGNPVTGTAKFMSSVITAVNLGIGVVAGISLGKLTGGMNSDSILNSTSYGTVPEWFFPLCILGTTGPTIILLDAKWSHFGQFLGGSALAYYLSSYATLYVGQSFGAWLAAAGVGVAGNIYGRITNYPAIEFVLWSILMLVPGSIGVRSVLADDTLGTVGFLQQMIGIAIAIVTGLFTANVVMPPLRAL